MFAHYRQAPSFRGPLFNLGNMPEGVFRRGFAAPSARRRQWRIAINKRHVSDHFFHYVSYQAVLILALQSDLTGPPATLSSTPLQDQFNQETCL